MSKDPSTNYVQSRWFCDKVCAEYHYGNCPKTEVIFTTTTNAEISPDWDKPQTITTPQPNTIQDTSDLDKQVDEIVSKHWAMVTGQRPIYEHATSEETCKAIKALISTAVREAQIKELQTLLDDPKAIFETSNFTDGSKLLKFILPQVSIYDRLAQLKEGDTK